ncbi:MAG: hypothetical protein KA144_02460 [Xanthomonadaceae bacterium]|nr:hypothetical protein [Xanthomonadaceae bacterium]
MKRNIALGLAATLAIGLATIGSANAHLPDDGWPTPNLACNTANEGQTYDLQFYSRRERLQITYFCDGFAWQPWIVCDLQPGGICWTYPLG